MSHLYSNQAPVYFFEAAVPAGFPSPAEGSFSEALDLSSYLIQNPPATFLVRASGDSMQGAGIFDGDILIVDRSVEARPGRVVIAVIDGEFTVKRLERGALGFELHPENPEYPVIAIGGEQDVCLWGVVTYVIHRP